jgi:UDP-glucose 4-epimerase
MKAILVTGGLGFIGSHTVVELVAAGYRPVIVDDLSNSELGVIERLQKLVGHDISFYQQDFQDIEKLRKIIEEEQISGIIHFAAFKAVGESVGQPLKYYQNNVAGFIELLTICEEIKIVKNLVFSSSCTVYGEPDSLPVTEDSPVKPAASPYGASKQMCEIILTP